MMAGALPACPHCGALQNEQARAESGRLNRLAWLGVLAGTGVGALVGWLAIGGWEPIVAGTLLGALVGRAIVAWSYSG
jgi:hypothetical protein